MVRGTRGRPSLPCVSLYKLCVTCGGSSYVTHLFHGCIVNKRVYRELLKIRCRVCCCVVGLVADMRWVLVCHPSGRGEREAVECEVEGCRLVI